MQEIDQLGSFYLGKVYDEVAKEVSSEYLHYDVKDLTTHAITVGMTGSGKTGLGIALLEEAALDGIPALIIDPKGDMANLLLQFPNLAAEDFKPWLHAEEAQRKGLSLDEYATQTAKTWEQGLTDWDQDAKRIQKLKDSTNVRVFTPGSSSGIPISLLQNIDVPSEKILEDAELLQEYASSTVSALLTLLGIESDSVNSREHILINSILQDQWKKGISLDLAGLIGLIQKPPMKQFGVLALEDFYPEKERQALAMQINNLLANPQFAIWMQGVPLDIEKFLFDANGKPCLSILSIQHLNEEERMFFVSSFLNALLSWVRSQTGTSTLRAMLYMDEIFGYFPPVANPPSKKPLLTLLKQARAYGLGIVLSTQNPVDLDYKGLSNIGTWFIGRLQTQNDQERLLSGLETAASEQNQVFDKAAIKNLLASMPGRVFLMNNVHENGPVLFHSRWAMSYLAGPMSRQQIASFKQDISGLATAGNSSASKPIESGQSTQTVVEEEIIREEDNDEENLLALKPTLADGVKQYYLPIARNADQLVYLPSLLGVVDITFLDKKHNVNTVERSLWNTKLTNSVVSVDWAKSLAADFDLDDLEEEAEAGLAFAQVPDSLSKKTKYTGWEKDLKDQVYRNSSLNLLYSPISEMVSEEGETKSAFVQRVSIHAREVRDDAIEDLRAKYQKKLDTLEERIRKAEQRLEKEKSQANQAKMNTVINVGSTILGGLFGRKVRSQGTVGRAASTVRAAGRARQQGEDVRLAEETVLKYQEDYKALEAELAEEMDALQVQYDEEMQTIEDFSVRPKKADINVRTLAVLWLPYEKNGQEYLPAYRLKDSE